MHSALPLRRSSNTSYMPKCLPNWRNWLIGRIWKKHIWTDCVTSWNGNNTDCMGGSRWTANKNWDAASHTTNPGKSKPTCHRLKKTSHCQNQCRQLKREKDPDKIDTNSSGNTNNKNGGQTNSNSNKKPSNKTNTNKTNNRNDRKPRTVNPPCETCDKYNHFIEQCYFGANAATRPPPRNRRPKGQNQAQQRDDQIGPKDSTKTTAQNVNWKHHLFTPEVHLTDWRPLKPQKFQKFARLSGSNHRRLL